MGLLMDSTASAAVLLEIPLHPSNVAMAMRVGKCPWCTLSRRLRRYTRLPIPRCL